MQIKILCGKIFLFFIFIFCASSIVAQDHRCSTYELHSNKMLIDPIYRAAFNKQFKQVLDFENATNPSGKIATDTFTTITIPVVVHVIYNAPEQNISDEQVQSQIDVLNEDYGAINSTIMDVPSDWQSLITDSHIRFKLAQRDSLGNYSTGITRTPTAQTSFLILTTDVKYDSTGGINGWPRNQYLNIWVCNLESHALGYAAFPGGTYSEDGIVISYKCFGRKGTSAKPYNLGRTTTHEIGHWLNLYHVWGDDGGDCSGDDQVSDTPLQGDADYRCPVFPKLDACSPNPPGIMYMNYLDYTDDKCMMFFTPGQISRMRATLFTTRNAILSSNGCALPNLLNSDLSIDSILTPVKLGSYLCVTPVINLKNEGQTTTTATDIYYSINAGLKKKYTLSDSLLSGQTKTVTLPEIGAESGDNYFEVWLNTNDNNTVNNYHSTSFKINPATTNNCREDHSVAYPNPVYSSGVICIKTKFNASQNSTVRVFNCTGQLVSEKTMIINPGDAFPLDLHSYSRGVYLVRIDGDTEKQTIKFIYMPDSNYTNGTTICN